MTEKLKEDPSALHREIKGLLSDFKASIKTCDPWDREIEFQRNNIRRRIVHLLFAFPYSSQAHIVEGTLWLDLVHAVILIYRQRMSALDQPAPGTPRPFVQLRKLQNRFRSFLGAEESFWSGLALRLVRTFELHEAKSALVVLNITSPDSDVSRDTSSHEEAIDTTQNPNQKPSQPGQREKKLLFVYKVLLYLGDLSRYREQYNESNGRPRASQLGHTDDWKPKKGRGGKKAAAAGPVSPRERDYSRATACYHQARLMLPDVGNASNQLAVLAIWSGDSFSSVYYCYRALCVKEPFQTAPENLGKTLHKAVDQRRKGMGGPMEAESDAFRAEVVYLHGLWQLKPRSSSLPKQLTKVAASLQVLVESRSLTSEVIVKTMVMALGALWHMRMYSHPPPETTPQGEQASKATPSKQSEPLILTHILDLFRILMEIGINEMQGVDLSSPIGQGHLGLAQRITATFRRTLPALRIASKWLKCHMEYLKRSMPKPDNTPPPTAFDTFWTTYAVFANALTRTFDSEVGGYSCPPLTMALEEDVDMQGFAPLKRSMFGGGMDGEGIETSVLDGGPLSAMNASSEHAVHPNEEQLMRIGDLLVDAKFISQSPVSLMYHRNDTFYPGTATDWIPSESLKANLGPGDQAVSDDASRRPAMSDDGDDDKLRVIDVRTDPDPDIEEDNATVSTRTDDDPVNLAMRATLDSEREEDFGDDDDEEEMILYPIQRKISAAPLLPSTTVQPRTPTSSTFQTLPTSPNTISNLTPPKGRVGGMPSSMTAEDLLAQAMNGGSLDLLATSSLRRPSSSLMLSPAHNHVAQPMLTQPTSTRSASFSGPSHNASAATSAPMLFGASSSVWGPTSTKNSPAPMGRRGNRRSQVQPSQAYSLSQSQIGLNHQLWGSPHDMFGGNGGGSSSDNSQRAIQQEQGSSPTCAPGYYNQTQSGQSPQQTYTGAPHSMSMPGAPTPPFNPTVGSPARPTAQADQLHPRQQMRHGPVPSLFNQYQLGPDAVGGVHYASELPQEQERELSPTQAYATMQQGMFAGTWAPRSSWG
ncbi:hypothetical protein FRB94_010245 [Tulasnella sp. JGI-2019a]|nr:hypothetical protein FRB94_010245 [Tulasnella sp. JGI-2019a]